MCMSLSLFICQMGLDGWQRQCVSTPVTMVMGAESVSGGGTHGHRWAPLEDIRRDAGQLSQCCCVPSTRLGELLRTCTPEQLCNVYSRVFVWGRVRQLRTRRLHWWEGGRRLRVGEAHMFGQQVAGLAQLHHSTAGSPNQTNFQHLRCH